ncbi:MAG TPA: LppX_LprAFG lipoprotein [Marmoricola sp.]|nr:LppX_LprAFG lipoprotein [Marmoricola sp.]
MALQSTLQRRAATVLAALLLLLVAGCGSSDDDETPEQSPAQVMEQAKRHFDEAASVHISLSTESTPSSGNGVLAATGTVTRDPAFEGDVKVILNGLTATVPVTSVGGKVYAQLPLQTKFSVIDPAEYGAPDPADFADPQNGLSALLTKMEGLEKGKETRSGDQILTSYSGTVPGAAVKRIIPSADAEADYDTTVGVDEDGRARTVKVTGTFFSGTSDTTYDVKFDRYGQKVEITPPTS